MTASGYVYPAHFRGVVKWLTHRTCRSVSKQLMLKVQILSVALTPASVGSNPTTPGNKKTNVSVGKHR